MSAALLLIDCQNDFCDPKGALYVPGAEKDVERIIHFIRNREDEIDFICFTLDQHVLKSVFHPLWFETSEGIPPAPFTPVRAADLEAGTLKALYFPDETLTYLQNLESQGQFIHTLWPPHCLTGSWGAALVPALAEEIFTRTARKPRRNCLPIIKGTHPLTEHYGIFRAQIPIKNAPETELNSEIINLLSRYDTVYVAGEAKSHCVATSVKQAMDFAPELAKKMVILENAMSNVLGFEQLSESIWSEAHSMMKFISVVE